MCGIHVWRDSFMCVTLLIHICHVTNSYVWQHSNTCVASRNHMCGIHVCHTAPSIRGWRRLIGCLKLQVIFCKRATKYRALLRKMTCKDKAPCDSTPPCTHSYISCDLFICVATLKHMCDTTQAICVATLNHMCDMTQSYEWQHSNICVT